MRRNGVVVVVMARIDPPPLISAKFHTAMPSSGRSFRKGRRRDWPWYSGSKEDAIAESFSSSDSLWTRRSRMVGMIARDVALAEMSM